MVSYRTDTRLSTFLSLYKGALQRDTHFVTLYRSTSTWTRSTKGHSLCNALPLYKYLDLQRDPIYKRTLTLYALYKVSVPLYLHHYALLFSLHFLL